jgi:hypothetical protein
MTLGVWGKKRNGRRREEKQGEWEEKGGRGVV